MRASPDSSRHGPSESPPGVHGWRDRREAPHADPPEQMPDPTTPIDDDAERAQGAIEQAEQTDEADGGVDIELDISPCGMDEPEGAT